MRGLRRDPVECLLAGAPALALLSWWIAVDGGYFATTWMAGAVLLVAVAASTAIATRAEVRPGTRAGAVALAALAAYAAWSIASIAWAGAPGDALEGALRVVAYLACFALFALAPWSPRALAVALVGFVGAVTAAGLWTLVGVAGAATPSELLLQGRLLAPLGYHNASAALWTMAALPALALAARRELPVWLRPPLLAAVALLLGLAVLSASRGWLFTLPIVAFAGALLAPDRLRLAAHAAVPLAAVALASPALLEVVRRGAELTPASADAALPPVLSHAALAAALATLGTLLAGTALVLAGRRPGARAAPAPRARRRLAIALAVALATGAGGVALAATDGDPLGALDRAVTEFARVDAGHDAGAGRLATLRGERYDIWRAALQAWAERPLIGLGQDNFADAYMLRRHSAYEEARWVHSLPLRVLVHTGLVGALLVAAFAAAAAIAARGAWRGLRADGRAVVGAALGPAVVWVAHGSVDWLWEFPALAVAALAPVGAVVALRHGGPPPRRGPRGRRAVVAAALAGAALAVAALVPALLAARELALAERAEQAPSTALEHVARARALNPLSSRPWIVEGHLRARRGELVRAAAAFDRAARREPAAWYPRFARGLVLAAGGRRAEALRELLAARSRNPRDPLVADALARPPSRPLTLAEARRRLRQRLRLRRNERRARSPSSTRAHAAPPRRAAAAPARETGAGRAPRDYNRRA